MRNIIQGKQFVIEAKNNLPGNVYIQSANLNGAAIQKPFFDHSALIKGGSLILQMGPSPNKKWGIKD